MNAYAIGADSPRWWWPSVTVGVVGAAAIAAILVLPANGSLPPGGTTRQDVPPPAGDPWFSTVDPGVDRQCFLLRPRAGVAQDHPSCGRSSMRQHWSSTYSGRPSPDSRP
jgi:hypothetical protein